MSEDILSYYETREQERLLNAERRKTSVAEDKYIVELYDLIRRNIYVNEVTYNNVCRALNVTWNVNKNIQMELLKTYLDMKIQTTIDTLADPILNEKW